jgi:hypothetical protein
MLMGFREYARHRGCTLQAVQKAIADGRISTVEDAAGKRKVDQVAADVAWSRNTDAGKRSLLFADGPSADAAEDANSGEEGGRGGDAPGTSDDSAMSPEYRAARAGRETLRLERERIELDQLRGKVISLEEASRGVYSAFRALRDRILNTPVRVKDQLAAETDPERCEQLLESELRAALTFDARKALRGVADDEDEEGDDE